MGFRYRKSIKLGKNVRLNLNKNSVGLSVGGKGGRVTLNSKGRMTTTVGIPGTGISYSDSKQIGQPGKRRAGRAPAEDRLASAMLEYPEFFDDEKTDEAIRARYSTARLKLARGMLYLLTVLLFLLFLVMGLLTVVQFRFTYLAICVLSLVFGVITMLMAMRYGDILKEGHKR